MKGNNQSQEQETGEEKEFLSAYWKNPRMKERKKYGLHKARRAVQFSKR